MEILEGDGLRRRIRESYSRNPKGWDFVLSPSTESGFVNALVSGPEASWMLKMDSLYKPFPTVLGACTERGQGKPTGAFPYGFRKLPPSLIAQLLGERNGHEEDQKIASLMSILKSETVVPEEGRCYAQGPFVLSGPGALELSEAQRELDQKLTSEMRRFMSLRFPAYG